MNHEWLIVYSGTPADGSARALGASRPTWRCRRCGCFRASALTPVGPEKGMLVARGRVVARELSCAEALELIPATEVLES